MKVKSESEDAQSCPTLSDPMDCSLQAPPSMGFSRQEYWSWVPLPSPSPQVTNTIIWIKKDETPNHPTPRYEEEKLKFYINLLLLLSL